MCKSSAPTITPVEKVHLKSLLDFLSNREAENLNFHVCYSPPSDVTAADKEDIKREAGGSIINQMGNDVVKFVKSCPIC